MAAHSRQLAGLLSILPLLAGLGLIALALQVDKPWIDRHVIQLHFWSTPTPARFQEIQRAILRGLWIGAILLFVVAGALRRGLVGVTLAFASRVALALVLALGAAELYLRWQEERHPRPRMVHEILANPHPRYGWLWKPSLQATVPVSGREIRLAFNRESIRVRSPDEELDPKAPSLLFAGESVAAGHGLQYEETFAALLSAKVGLQSVNLAVNGFGSDQAYLRLIDALPRFEHVLATVTTFLPVQLGRNLQDVKPRLVLSRRGTLEIVPAANGVLAQLRLRKLFVNGVPYSTDREIATTIALTRAILRDTVRQTEARGAKAIFLIPLEGPRRALEEHGEAWLIHSIFEAEGLPYVLVDLDGELTLGDGPHPSPQGAKLVADALAHALANPTH